MWLRAITAACTPYAGVLLSRNNQPAVFGLFDVMATLDYGLNLKDDLYQHCMSGLDHLGVLLYPATLRRQQQDIQNMCTSPSTSILADSAGKVQCQEDRNCGFYSILNGINCNSNKVR